MDLLNRYFGDLVLFKADSRESYAIYAANVSTGILADGKSHYVLVFVPHYLATKPKAFLRELQFHNLQTRMMQNPYQLPRQKWEIPRDAPDIFFNVVGREKHHSTYRPEQPLPFELLLLHDPKKQSVYQHYGRVGLIGSLLTFRCVLNFTGEITNVQTPSHVERDITPLNDERSFRDSKYQTLSQHSQNGNTGYSRQPQVSTYIPPSTYTFGADTTQHPTESLSSQSRWAEPPAPTRVENFSEVEFIPQSD